MKEIDVSGQKVILDDDTAEWARAVGLLVMGGLRGGAPRVYTRLRLLSSVIAPARKGYVVDHINGNTMDNRRENLQVITIVANARKKRVTEHPGVCVRPSRPGVYRVDCVLGRNRSFRDLAEAKRAADEYRRSLGIKGMPLNFPEVGEHYWDGRLRTE